MFIYRDVLVGSDVIKLCTVVRNLGALVVEELTLYDYVS